MTAMAKRVRTIQVAGPTTRHYNNTLRAWEGVPLSVVRA